MEIKTILVWILMFVIGSDAESLEIINATPDALHVVKGKSAQVRCESNLPFYQCKWTRPNELGACGVFKNQAKSDCSSTLTDKEGSDFQVTPWSISIEDNVCLLNLDQVGLDEAGIWTCFLEDNDGGTDTANFQIRLLKQPELQMIAKQTLEMVGAKSQIIECNIAAAVESQPSEMQWRIDDQVIDQRGNSITVTPSTNWNDKTISCFVTQNDSFGNAIETSDARQITVKKQSYVDQAHQGKTTKAGEFQMSQHYPQNDIIVLAKNNDVTFRCMTSTSWFDCKWKHPGFPDPCGMHHYTGPTVCPWSLQNGGRWTIQKESDRECIITGSNVDVQDAGVWDCHLGSFPIEGKKPDIYEHAKNNFRLQMLTKAVVNENQLEKETILTEGEVSEITVTVDNADAYPKPHFEWFLNGEKIEDHQSVANNELTHTYKYEAKLSDTGFRLLCKVSQYDDDGNPVETEVSTVLKIQAKPPEEGIGKLATIISSAVVAGLIVLIVIAVVFLYMTNRACFAARRGPVVRERTIGATEVQTVNSQPQVSDFGTGVDFGPQKPLRSAASRDELNRPLLAADQEDGADKLEVLLSIDELNPWNYEGEGLPKSRATSLSSLDTQVSDKDWYETFKSFGPKFQHLAQMFEGTDSSDEGGTEV